MISDIDFMRLNLGAAIAAPLNRGEKRRSLSVILNAKEHCKQSQRYTTD